MLYKTIEVTKKQNITIIHIIERRIFLQITDDFRNEVLSVIDEGVEKVIIDLSAVNVMNSSGLGVLMLVRDKMEKHKGILVLCGLQPIMAEIFTRMHLDTFFKVYQDQDEALLKLQTKK
jgi:anti-sigma B factor antagonist